MWNFVLTTIFSNNDVQLFSTPFYLYLTFFSYSFLEKDSVLQCEEIRSVSKVRLDVTRGCIGKLSEADMNNIKSKFKRAYNL